MDCPAAGCTRCALTNVLVEDSLDGVEKRIVELKELTRQMYTKRNALVSIGRLPPELLTTIFAFVVAGASHRVSLASTFNFTHVSCYWRQLAFASPELWSSLTSRSLPWCQVMLQRAKAANLSVDMADHGRDPEQMAFFRDVISKHISRIETMSLALHLPCRYTSRFLKTFPTSSPGKLRFLKITMSPGGSQRPRLRDQCLMGTSVLLTLELHNCDFDWNLPELKNLSTLKVLNGRALSPMDQIIRSLVNTPALEVLELTLSLLDANLDNSKLLESTALRNLRELALTCDIDQTIILRHLVVPATARVNIDCSSGASSDTASNTLSLSLNVFTSSLIIDNSNSKALFAHLDIRSRGLTSIVLKFDAVDTWPRPGFLLFPHLTLIIPKTIPKLSHILSGLPLHLLNSLSIDTHFTSIDFLQSFGPLNNLKHVCLTRECLSEALRGPLAPLSISSATPPPLPNLESLLLERLDDFGEWEIQLQQVRDYLKKRSEGGWPIQTLYLGISCSLRAEEIASLEEEVKVKSRQ
ncbi:hypothetical protein CPB83DRAFT_906622 [Crepidotus variabilis]|uniref:F-box domain-containing protein n=1 Tax=Crepidotus variabilis TaxID=179855 RepID=A0A9P6EGR5_9AGAR|nr:hypothetical protein CPB83DRAFT_906622 [Crepidotus variabilis]